MSKKLFVGNIAWSASEDDLHNLFSQQGEVEDLIILKDKFTNRSKGFGFVTFTNEDDANNAISELNGYNLNGRDLVVNEAKPPRPRNRY
jgi:RNA recognition motif-containing protein